VNSAWVLKPAKRQAAGETEILQAQAQRHVSGVRGDGPGQLLDIRSERAIVEHMNACAGWQLHGQRVKAALRRRGCSVIDDQHSEHRVSAGSRMWRSVNQARRVCKARAPSLAG
jgi:hypothetical protein